MAAITYWVDPVDGDDANDGLSFANAFETHVALIDAIQAAGNGNDYTINLVNTGTHVQTTNASSNQIDNQGLSNFHIRGTDSSGNPALATVAPNSTVTAVTQPFLYIREHASILIEYLNLDGTGRGSGSSCFVYAPENPSTGPLVEVRYCRAIGSELPRTTTTSYLPTFLSSSCRSSHHVHDCYFQGQFGNVLSVYNYSGASYKVYNNVSIDGGAFTSTLSAFTLTFDPQADIPEAYNNTWYMLQETSSVSLAKIVQYSPFSGSVDGVVFKNNVYWVDNLNFSGFFTAGGFVLGQTSGSATFNGTEDVGYNMFYTGPDVATQDIENFENYRGLPWAPGADDLYTGDIRRDNQADTAVFLDPDSTYDWTPEGSSVSLTIARDLRLMIDQSAGEGGTTPGALPAATTDYTVQVNSTRLNLNSGETVTLRAAISNDAEGQDADAVVDVVLPEFLTVVSTTPSTGTWTSSTNKWSLALAAGASATLLFSCTVDSGYGGVSGTFSATVNSDESDPGAGGDTSDDTDSITLSVIYTDVTTPDNPARVPYIDVLPLTQPVVELDMNVSLKTTRNRAQENYVRDDVEDTLWAEARMLRMEVAADATTSINLGGIQRATYLFVESDEPVQLSLAGTSVTFLPQAKAVVLAEGDFEQLAVKNPSSSTAANVLIVVVD